MSAVEQLKNFFTANRRALRFLASFALIFGVLYFVFGIAQGVRSGLIQPFTVFLARAVTAIINLFGAGATSQGVLVQSPDFALSIAMGCDGVEATCLFVAGVLAFPTSWRARLVGLALGVPLVQLINILRLVGLYYVGVFMPAVVEEVHVYVAQTLVILLSTAVLIFWLERVATRVRAA